MANEVRILVTAQDQASGTFNKVSAGAVAMGGTVALVVDRMIGSLTEMAKGAFSMGIEFNAMKEQAQIAFTSMLGSGNAAKAFLDELQDFAARTPFEFPDLLEGSQRLLAMGFAAQDLIPTMTALGDSVAAMGGNSVMIDRLTLALGQMLAKGKVSGEEMRQFAEAGIPAWRFLAEHIGVSIPEAMKLAEEGAIDAATGIEALTEGMNREFGGMMEEQANSFSGLISTLKDNARIFAGEVTLPLFNDLKAGLQTFMAWFDQNKVAIRSAFLDMYYAFSEVMKGITYLVNQFGPFIWDYLLYPVRTVVMKTIEVIRFLHQNWRDIGNAILGVVEAMTNGIIDALNKTIDKIGDFLEMVRNVPGLGRLTGLPEGQIFEGGSLGEVSIPRIGAAFVGGTPPDDAGPIAQWGVAAAQLHDSLIGGPSAPAGMSGGGGGLTGAAKSAKDAIDEMAERMQRAAERIQEQQTSEIVEAFLTGGMAQVETVRETHAKLDEQWKTLADDLHSKLGIEVPDEFRGMWERILDEQKKAAQKIVDEERKLAQDRLDAMRRQSFDVTKQLFAGAGAGTSPEVLRDLRRTAAEAARRSAVEQVLADVRAGEISQHGGIQIIQHINAGAVADPAALGREAANWINQAASLNGGVLSSRAVQS